MLPFGRTLTSPKMPENYKGRTDERKPHPVRELSFDTNHYCVVTADEAREPAQNIQRVPFKHFADWSSYDLYLLVDDPSITIQNFDARVPKIGNRLSDRLVAIALQLTCYTAKDLSQNWPADFDTRGMVHATRMPVGEACTIPATVETRGIDGTGTSRSAKFYGWVGGIHLLCGKGGLDAGLYTVRPNYEKKPAKELGSRLVAKSCLRQRKWVSSWLRIGGGKSRVSIDDRIDTEQHCWRGHLKAMELAAGEAELEGSSEESKRLAILARPVECPIRDLSLW